MYLDSLLTLALLATPTLGLLRFPCSQLTTERMDPLVFPGVISPHVHQIIGGNAFNITMDPNLDYGRTATCTTCRFQEDKSNYWTAILYFKHPNGTYIRVPQKANHAVGSPNGGMTVYYIQPNDGSKVTSFPPGFRMVSGDPMLRTRPARRADIPATYSSTFRCWQGTDIFDPSNQGAPGSGATDSVELPNKPCAAGIRSNLYFPSCWDGVNLDSPNHSSHVAFYQGTVGAGGLFLSSGRCPSTHPVQIPMILYETAWDTTSFNSMWPTDGSQPFVFSMGDPTGYGQHGDYVFGWEGDSLQRAMDTCTDISGVPEGCSALHVIQDSQINQCKQNNRVPEEILNVRSLPGCNPIQNGPAYATYPASCDAVTTTIDGANPSLPPVYVTGSPNPNPNPNPSPNPTPTPSPTPTPAPGPTIPKWGQCGGQDWTGGTTCAAGSTCTFLNQWYSQCL